MVVNITVFWRREIFVVKMTNGKHWIILGGKYSKA